MSSGAEFTEKPGNTMTRKNFLRGAVTMVGLGLLKLASPGRVLADGVSVASVTSTGSSEGTSMEVLGAAMETRELVGSWDRFNPLRISNPLSGGLRTNFAGSSVTTDGPISVDGNIRFLLSERTPENSGILILNGQSSDNYLKLLASSKTRSLSLERKVGQQGNVAMLRPGLDGDIDFSLQMSNDGGVAKVVLNHDEVNVYRFVLNPPFYQDNKVLRLAVDTGAYAETRVSSLSLTSQNVDPLANLIFQGQPLEALAPQRGISIGTVLATRKQHYSPVEEGLIRSQFNHIVIGPGFIWKLIHPTKDVYNFGEVDNLVNFALSKKLEVFGQNLIWPNYDQKFDSSSWVTQNNFSGSEMKGFMEEHIKTIMARYRGIITQWVVTNEAVTPTGLRESPWRASMGDGFILQAHRFAREADSDALLMYNDFGNERPGPKADRVFELARQLKAEGLVDAVGMQMHVNIVNPPSKQDIFAEMRRYGDIGVQVIVTEMDVNMAGAPGSYEEKAQRQARVYRDVLEAALESGNCRRFTVWGTIDKNSWLFDFEKVGGGKAEAPLLFDDNGLPKPAYYALQGALAV